MGTLKSKPRNKHIAGLALQLFNSYAQSRAMEISSNFQRGLTPTAPTGMPIAGPSHLDHSVYSATNATEYVTSNFFFT